MGPGDAVGGRYELIRMLGGGEGGRVYVAYDRHLEREVALRLVEGGPSEAADMLLEEGRRMADVHAHSPAAVAVLDAGTLDDGGAYTATELVAGVPLEEVARRRGPLPVGEANGYAVALLDACMAVRRHAHGGPDTLVASAVATKEGRIRVTRFERASAPGPAGAEPAVAAVAETLLDLLAGSQIPPVLRGTIDDALEGRIRTAAALRGRLLGARHEAPTAVLPPPPPAEPSRRWWPWVLGAIVLIAVGVAAFLLLGGDDGERAAVPDVAGQTASTAVSTLRSAGFAPRTVGQTSEDVARGVVIGTSPAAGDDAELGSEVVVNVSQGSGEAVVPALAGLSRDDAEGQLVDAGLEARFVDQESASVPEGDVIGQDPAAGVRIPAGSTVVVTLSTGVATVAVPDLTGRTVDQAATELQAAGLGAGAVTLEQRSDVPAGTIVDQDPPAGDEVPQGTSVDVTVADDGTSTGG